MTDLEYYEHRLNNYRRMVPQRYHPLHWAIALDQDAAYAGFYPDLSQKG